MGNNEQALSALGGFIDRLKSSATPISKGIVDSGKESILGPIDQSIQDQRRLIKQIEADLRQTEAEQQGTRETLAEQEKQVQSLRARYEDLMEEMEALVG